MSFDKLTGPELPAATMLWSAMVSTVMVTCLQDYRNSSSHFLVFYHQKIDMLGCVDPKGAEVN